MNCPVHVGLPMVEVEAHGLVPVEGEMVFGRRKWLKCQLSFCPQVRSLVDEAGAEAITPDPRRNRLSSIRSRKKANRNRVAFKNGAKAHLTR